MQYNIMFTKNLGAGNLVTMMITIYISINTKNSSISSEFVLTFLSALNIAVQCYVFILLECDTFNILGCLVQCRVLFCCYTVCAHINSGASMAQTIVPCMYQPCRTLDDHNVLAFLKKPDRPRGMVTPLSLDTHQWPTYYNLFEHKPNQE